jgi:hypothetical protein
MPVKRFSALTGSVVALGLMVGVVQASAQGSTTELKFYAKGQTTAVGFNINSNTPPPVGANFVISGPLKNIGTQFGKPSGAVVGRFLIECTVLAENTQSLDGICNGIAHVPNGYVTFDGNGPFASTKVNYYDVTGGIGPYANDRGEIKGLNSVATVTLYS